MLVIKTIIGLAFQILLIGAILLIPAGTFYWNDALIWLLAYSVVTGIGGIYLVIKSPNSVEARMRTGNAKQPIRDKVASAFLFTSTFAGFLLCPLDLFHWQFAEAPNETLKIMGLILYILGLIVILGAMAANEFAAPTVLLQEEEGQKVADTGLYAYVRHPMYTGFIFMMIGTFLWLGTYFSLFVGSLMFLTSLAFRINVEEKVLIAELKGYKEYSEKVKSRLIPFIF